MRKKIKAFLSSTIFLLFAGLFAFASIFFFQHPQINDRVDREWGDRIGALQLIISHTLGEYRKETKRTDSLMLVIREQDPLNYADKELERRGRMKLPLPFEIYRSTECNQCIFLKPGYVRDYETDSGKNDMSDHYYLAFDNYKLKDPNYYFRYNNQDYLFSPPFIADGTRIPLARVSGNDAKVVETIHTLYGEIFHPIRYRYDHWNNRLLIPVNKATYDAFNIVRTIISILCVIYLFILFFSIPLRIIKKITEGKAFEEKTIRLIDFLAYNFILYPFIVLFLKLLTRLILSSYITSDVYFTGFYEFLKNGWVIYIGIILLAFGVALKKGYKLQKENDLTI